MDGLTPAPKSDRYDKLVTLTEHLIYPASFWYVVFFIVWKLSGHLTLSWWNVLVPFPVLFLLLFFFGLFGVFEGIQNHRKFKAELQAKTQAAEAEYLRLIEQKIAEAKRDAENKPGAPAVH